MGDAVASEAKRRRLIDRYRRLEESRAGAPVAAIVRRLVEVDFLTQSTLLAVELFTTVIPLMIIGFAHSSGFAENASVGDALIKQLGLTNESAEQVRATFGSAAALRSTWTFFGLAGFLVWGIPMSITVAAMFARAWRREQFPILAKLGRGAVWFVLYLAMFRMRAIVGATSQQGAIRILLFVVALVPQWIFWTLTPVLLVRDGARGRRSLVYAGLAGMLIEGVVLTLAARIVLPLLLSGWTEFGPIGVAMTLMTWCGVLGVGWVVVACVGAVLWERDASMTTVLAAQTADFEPSA